MLDDRKTLLDHLEKRFRRFAIPHLIHHVVVLNVLGWAFHMSGNAELLLLDRETLADGEVWRLFTHLFVPPRENPIFLMFYLILLWVYGRALEATWGAFRFNAFYFLGAVLTTVAVAFFGPPVGEGLAGSFYLNLSVFFAFATLFPDFTIHVFFVLPVRIKWLAWIGAAVLFVQCLGGGPSTRALVVTAMSNYLLFFWRPFVASVFYAGRRQAFRRKVESGRGQHFHECAVCKRTERDDPGLQFRVCPDCSDALDYCQEHLEIHEHR